VIDIHHGDCRQVMFMGKEWDSFKPGDIAMRRNPAMDAVNAGASRQGGRQRSCSDYQKRQRRDMLAFQEAMESVFLEALRVAKPGAHLLAFGGTRTYHRLACAIEDAGWEIRDCIMWCFGSGFPKSHDVSKAIDKAAGAERKPELVPTKAGNTKRDRGTTYATETHAGFRDISTPATDAARQWQGWGTALKPAYEPIIVARKPLVGTVAENVLTHGTGAINVDGCRVGMCDADREAISSASWDCRRLERNALSAYGDDGTVKPMVAHPSGRWPANLIHDGSDEVVGLFPQTTSGKPGGSLRQAKGMVLQGGGNGTELTGYADSGSAARFFYCAKASKADRGSDNKHPTVKPTDLMRYLCRLVTPPGGVVLDPFTGSGSTGKAAILEGFRFIGIEREAEYVEIAKARIAAAVQKAEAVA
jgi:hypothetical protein